MKQIATDNAPSSIGPYSQAIRDGNRIYVSGQGPINHKTGDIVGDTIESETTKTLENIQAILEAAGSSLENVCKATVFIQNMENYDAINNVYGEYMSEPYPARSAIQVEDLPVDIGVEIEVVATV